uniref:Putative evasin n=1 Tax=Ixodes ricinus TaxID=34613 RepID=A0A6B0UQE1_IXORI
MLLLLAILVVIISEIESGSPPSAMKTEDILEVLGSTSSLQNHTDSGNCKYQELLDLPENIEDGGFLAINCKKECPDGEQDMVNGYECIFKVKKKNKDTRKVRVGLCQDGTCVRKNPFERRTIVLADPE